jgi:hypothetical protein
LATSVDDLPQKEHFASALVFLTNIPLRSARSSFKIPVRVVVGRLKARPRAPALALRVSDAIFRRSGLAFYKNALQFHHIALIDCWKRGSFCYSSNLSSMQQVV